MPDFTSAYARGVLESACRLVDEDAADADLLRLGQNAIFRLSGRSRSIVVRVGRDLTRLPIMRRELCVARWLNGLGGGVPSIRVYEAVPDQPRVVAGYPVTFWHAVDPGPEPPTTVDLARLLRQLHSLTDSPCDLSGFAPLAEVRARLSQGLPLRPADRDFVSSRCDALTELLPKLQPVLTPGPIHGDAHTGNLLGGAGAAVLTDFEASAIGPREWDLVPLSVGRTRFRLPAADWDRFVEAYGFDVRAWSGYPVLREVRELGMTTWLAQNAHESDAIAREVAVRIESLRNGDHHRGWTAF